MVSLWLTPALICYALAAAAFAIELVTHKTRWTGWGVLLLAGGSVFHGLDLAALGLEAGNIPVASFRDSLSFLAWIAALTSMLLIVRLRTSLIGVIVAPVVLVALAGAVMMRDPGALPLPAALRSAWLPVHVTLAFVGEALFLLAASVSLAYLVYESRLKGKRPLTAEGDSAPSLERLDRLNYRLLGWGFVLLSLAIVTGAIWAEATWGRFWSWEPRESWALVTWMLYAALLESRATVGWRGRRAAALTIAVFTVLVGSYIGVNLVYPGKHGGSFG